MKKKKGFKHYKFLIGLILGVIVSATGAYAATTYASNSVYYINTNSTLTSTNVQGAIDELAAKYAIVAECPVNKICNISNLGLGSYVSYTPTITSYTIDTSVTGYTGTSQAGLNPSELKVWRVLRINVDLSVDIISEYVSSTAVYFSGETGYRNYVGYLNTLARQYENSTYTSGSRYFGYNGQTEYITEADAPQATYFSTTPPWTCSTGNNCNPDETKGGGDELYEKDYDLVYTALGTRVANKVNTTSGTSYWMASREYTYSTASKWYWRARNISSSSPGDDSFSNLYTYNAGNFSVTNASRPLRPIVTLKSGLMYNGKGTKSSPFVLSVRGN